IPSPTTATPESHPDCRADLIQIVALQTRLFRICELFTRIELGYDRGSPLLTVCDEHLRLGHFFQLDHWS
ncbi:hypothetical protein ACCS93_37785, partial [Rhizobium ruizarguesonis]